MANMIDSSIPMSAEAAQNFGRQWAECWNRGDIEGVLAHFAEECVFESPLAEAHCGRTRLVGKAPLRQYWQKALAAIGKVQFDVDFVATAPAQRSLTIVYRARLGSRHLHACERLSFDGQGRVCAGMGLYGPPVYTE